VICSGIFGDVTGELDKRAKGVFGGSRHLLVFSPLLYSASVCGEANASLTHCTNSHCYECLRAFCAEDMHVKVLFRTGLRDPAAVLCSESPLWLIICLCDSVSQHTRESLLLRDFELLLLSACHGSWAASRTVTSAVGAAIRRTHFCAAATQMDPSRRSGKRSV
jgi:hypothetical protein